jgi:hypothetical protein
MQDATWQSFSERVAYDDGLHVSCVALPQPLDDQQRAAMRERNLSVLGTLAVFNERRSEGADEENPLTQDIQRLDSKLNVLMAMLEQLLRRDGELPPRVKVSFNAIGALLPTAIWPAGQTRALVRLHFDGCLALPLELAAQRVQERDADHIFAVFESMDEATCDAIERLVFRHHRRKVAERRLGAG